MQNNTRETSPKSFSDKVKKENQNITCKDGFCFIPNLDEDTSINKENSNIFDPI